MALDGRVLAGCKSAGMLTVVHQENGFDHVYFWAIKQHYTIKVMILMSLYEYIQSSVNRLHKVVLDTSNTFATCCQVFSQ